MTAFDVARTMLSILGLAAILIAAVVGLSMWQERRRLARHLDARRDSEHSDAGD